MTKTVTLRSQVAAAADQLSCDLDGEAAILSLASGQYYGLDAVGARIWQLVRERRAVQDVLDRVLEEYDVDRERCERDVLALLQELADAGLVEVG